MDSGLIDLDDAITGEAITKEAVASVIASTLPTPPPSDPVLPDGAGDAVTDEVLEAVKRIDAEMSNISVATVHEPATALTPDTPDQAKKRLARLDLQREMWRAEFPGITEEKLDRLCAKKETTGSKQRVHPTHRTVCHPSMVAFWDTKTIKDKDGNVITVPRTDADIEADALKQMRNDGGQLGPVGCYLQLIEEASSKAAAAAAINDHVTRRIKHLRIYLCSAINELRRRRAVAAGIDPKTIDYLAVR